MADADCPGQRCNGFALMCVPVCSAEDNSCDVGGYCTQDNHCKTNSCSGNYCFLDTSLVSDVYAQRKGPGGTCNAASDCYPPLTCSDSVCSAFGITLASLQTTFGGSCSGGGSGPWSYSQFRGQLADAISTVFTDAQTLCILGNTVASAGCGGQEAVCTALNLCSGADSNAELVETCGGGGGGGGGEPPNEGCQSDEACSDLFAGGSLSADWVKTNQINNYNRCVDSAVADGVLTLEAANDEGCTGFSSKLEKKIAVSADALSDGGSLTVDLNIGSWSNLVGNNDYIGITIANQDETGGVPAMSIGFAGGDAIQCFSNLAMGGSVATSLDDNPCDLGATVSDTPVVLRLVVTSPNGQGKATPYYKIGDGNFVQLGGGNGFSWKSAMEFSIAISTGINGPDNFGVVIDSINVTVPALPD